MNKLKIALVTAGLAAATLLCFHGAHADDKPTTMLIGIVDVNRVLADNADYQKKSQEYMDERKKLFDPGKAKSQKDFQAALIKRKPEIEAAEARWTKIKTDFIAQNTERIRKASDQVMLDKHLSFVLQDAPWYQFSPLRQYGAVDVTTDVLLALKNPK